MVDWLRLVAMIFYAPLRGMREVRDRGSLFPAIISAYLSQVVYVFAVQWHPEFHDRTDASFIDDTPILDDFLSRAGR